MITADNAESILQISSEARKERKPFDYACEKLLDRTDIVKWANECNRRDYAGRSQRKVAHVSNDYKTTRMIANTHQTNFGQPTHKKGPSLRYENDLWNSISPEDKALLVEIRKRARQNLEQPQQTLKSTEIPSQYQKAQANLAHQSELTDEPPSSANHVTIQEEDAQSEASEAIADGAVAMLAQRDDALERFFNYSTRQIRMSSTVSEAVRCHAQYFDRIAQLVHSEASSIATAYSGAGTNVLGRDWLIVSEDPFRHISLVGFDAAHAQKRDLRLVTVDTIGMTEDGQEVILRAHQSVSNPSTRTALLSDVQMRHAGHVVDSVHRSHQLTLDGARGTQTLYLKDADENTGLGSVYRVPFIQRAGLMTFDHCKPDPMDYNRDLPIVILTLDGRWEPGEHYDDHGELVIAPLSLNAKAQLSVDATKHTPTLSPPITLSAWMYTETCTIFHPPGSTDPGVPEVYQDAKFRRTCLFDGPISPINLPCSISQREPKPHPMFLCHRHVDDFLGCLSYSEPLGFLPDDPGQDTYIFAICEMNTFCMLAEDPSVFFHDDDLWYDPTTVDEKGGPRPRQQALPVLRPRQQVLPVLLNLLPWLIGISTC
jgi:hypothetical protein